jgi:hypothetical protein
MTSFLINGPMMTTIERRQARLEDMAKDLIADSAALATDRDAVRVLLAKGYPTVDVAILAGEARMLAYQEIVAAEMSKP